MNRRDFIQSAGALALPMQAAPGAPKTQAKITRIIHTQITGRFHRFVAMNAYDPAPKGHTYTNTLVRIQTSEGVEGIGVMSYGLPDAKFEAGLRTLIGKDPGELYEWKDGLITGRSPLAAETLRTWRHLDSALFDLIGKLQNKPAWRLLSNTPARETIEVYDGTLYFSDIWFSDRGTRAVVEECEEAAKMGYRGMKLKLGRGSKWMQKDEGLKRDIEVCLAVRKALGSSSKVLVDANNGYRDNFEGAWKLVQETAPANLYWLEELFPETVPAYRELRARMGKAGIRSLIAEGESVSNPRDFDPYLTPEKLFDVVQMDIRTGGLVDNAALARFAAQHKAVSVPHNWGSTVGGLMGLHLSKAISGAAAAEDDRSTCAVIQVDGYTFRNGFYTVPDEPGLSIHLDQAAYTRMAKDQEVVIG
jgi:D-galactarolactone cycloisomerase